MTSDRRWWICFAAVLAGALAVRVALIVATPHFAPAGDPADYQRHAVSIATGHGMAVTEIAGPGTPSALRPPAYPYLLGLLYAVIGIHASAARGLDAILGALTVALLMLLVARVWDRRWALVAGAVAALYPPLIALNGSLLSESLFVPLELAIALALVSVARGRAFLRWCGVAGALCAVAALTRTVGLVWLIPAVVVVARAGVGRRSAAVGIAVLVGAAVLVLAPWTVRNADAFHAFVPLGTEDGFTLAGQYNREAGRSGAFDAVWLDPVDVPSLRPVFARLSTQTHDRFTEVQLDSALRSSALNYFDAHPSHLLVAASLDSLRMLDLGANHGFTTTTAYEEMGLPHSLWRITSLSAQLVALIALLGLVLGLFRRIRLDAGAWWLWSLPILATAGTVVTSGSPRYRAPADPFLILLAVLAVRAMARSRYAAAR
jgi:4-amino-4-deoxy-L-arabinose transferase-like glycosyltransferase